MNTWELMKKTADQDEFRELQNIELKHLKEKHDSNFHLGHHVNIFFYLIRYFNRPKKYIYLYFSLARASGLGQ